MKSNENRMNSECPAQANLSLDELWYGRAEPPVHSALLHAGPLTALWEGGDLRSVRAGNIELVRRAYVSVRDENWDTIPSQTRNVASDIGKDGFLISYDAESRSRSLEFQWHASIKGDETGNITLKMDGHATRDFWYSRIGFCILHPLSEYCGRPFNGFGPVGPIGGILPTLIAPQRYEGGFYLPLFPSFSSLSFSLKSNVKISFAFEGDLFEMEDQRNWTDGSFKTYCTPLSLGYPHQAHAGQSFSQQVTFTVEDCLSRSGAGHSAIQLHLGASLQRPLPQIGLSVASHDLDLSSNDVDLLAKLNLNHLRADLHLGQPGVTRHLARAERECGLLHCGVELALFVSDNADQELSTLADLFPLSVPVSRILIFHQKELTTSPRWIEIARRAFGTCLPRVSIFGGTNLYFADLNRSRPDVDQLDGVAYSINPQVHASDERSLVENLEGQSDTVVTARSFCGNRPIVVSPITLKPRFNPDASGPEPPPLPGELPSAVDARQISLFAATWTLGSIKQLAEAGATSLTFYETTGWRGVKETEQGSLAPELFRSIPGMIFPIYHVIADLADLKGAELFTCNSSDPLRVQGLALKKDGHMRILLANLTSQSQNCNLEPLRGEHVKARSLDSSNALLAMTQPEEFRSRMRQVELSQTNSTLSLTLQPYGVLRIDSVSIAP
jgi:D-apionolactonase